MSFLELAKRRYSVRKYKEKPVEEEKLMQILEAGRVAPTGASCQAQRIIVIKRKEGLEKLGKGASVYGAPLAFIVCGDSDKTWVRSYDKKNIIDIDASIITDHMMLQATDLGLGSLWMTWFNPEIIKQEFNIPDGIIPVNILLAGYADGDIKSPDRHDTERKPLSETVVYESF